MEHDKKDDDDILSQYFQDGASDFDKGLEERAKCVSTTPASDLKITPTPKSIASQEMMDAKKIAEDKKELEAQKSASVEDISEKKSNSQETKEIEVSPASSDVPVVSESTSELDKKLADAVAEINAKPIRVIRERAIVEPPPIPKSDPNYSQKIIETQITVSHVREIKDGAFPMKYVTEETVPLPQSEHDDLIAIFGEEKKFLVAECKDDLDKVIERIKINARLVAAYKMKESADINYRDELIGKLTDAERKIARAKMSEGQRVKKSAYKEPLQADKISINALKDIGRTAEQIKEKFMKGNRLTPDVAHYIDKLFREGDKVKV